MGESPLWVTCHDISCDTCFLSLDSTKKTQEVHKHDTVCKLRPVIQTIDLVAILRNSSKWNNIVRIESQCHVNVVNSTSAVEIRKSMMLVRRSLLCSLHAMT